MAYEKRVCVLKQIKKGFSADGGTLSGAIYAERLGAELTVTPRILGIAPVKEGRYALALWAEGETAVLELMGNEPLRVDNFPSVKGGFAALLVFIKGDPEPIAFGSCGVAPVTHEVLLEALVRTAKKRSEPSKRKERAEEFRPFREQAATRYDDEAIAQSDYYQRAADENDDAHSAGGEDETAQADGTDAGADESLAYLDPRGSLTYYNSVRQKLEEAFLKFPKDERLRAVFPYSEWVRTENAILGVIYEHGAPKYLCVAIEAKGDAPEEMKAHACFVPASHFTEEEGFWVVFQSADTGEYVTVSNS